jgi:CCR4-NOT transcription complex subunit 3
MQQQVQYQYQQDSAGSNQQRYGNLGAGSQKQLQFRHNPHSIPQEQDRTWRSKASRGKTVSVPASYPSTQPLALVRDPSIYERFDGETLFFAFYYQPGTYNQHLAARALKKKNWRFNKQHNAWFQRLKEPLFVTAEHEQGSYIWFDYHMIHEDGTRGWRPRVKENFVFEYKELVD